MNFLLVPVIMLCAIVGTVGMLKLIQNFFPNAERIIGRAEDWIDKQK